MTDVASELRTVWVMLSEDEYGEWSRVAGIYDSLEAAMVDRPGDWREEDDEWVLRCENDDAWTVGQEARIYPERVKTLAHVREQAPPCPCPQSGVSAKCPLHGRDLAEHGWDEDGKLVHRPMEWDHERGEWVHRDAWMARQRMLAEARSLGRL